MHQTGFEKVSNPPLVVSRMLECLKFEVVERVKGLVHNQLLAV